MKDDGFQVYPEMVESGFAIQLELGNHGIECSQDQEIEYLYAVCSRTPLLIPRCVSGWQHGHGMAAASLSSLHRATSYYPDRVFFLVSVSVSSCIPYHPNHIDASTRSYPVNDGYSTLCVICVVHARV